MEELEWKYEQLSKEINEGRKVLEEINREIFALKFEKETLKEQIEVFHNHLETLKVN